MVAEPGPDMRIRALNSGSGVLATATRRGPASEWGRAGVGRHLAWAPRPRGEGSRPHGAAPGSPASAGASLRPSSTGHPKTRTMIRYGMRASTAILLQPAHPAKPQVTASVASCDRQAYE